MLSFGEKIKSARKSKNLTQKQLAAEIGAAHNSISDWENNKNKPDPDTIELLCGVLDITPNYLLATSSSDFSPQEKLLVKKYRDLDNHGKEMVDFTLEKEWERTQQPVNTKISGFSQNIRCIQYYQRLASAGTGQIVFEDMPIDRIEIPDIPEYKRVSYAIGVNGHSMEPTYNDGDILLIEPTCQIDVGEIGIFIVGNEAFVKQLGESELISLNKEYKNITLTKDSKCMGRVVDKFQKEVIQ